MSFDVLKQSLLKSTAWKSDASVKLIETHISCVFLVGDRAYKVKKPVNLGFVNFSTRKLRRHFCDEELRLNRRLAPEIYLRVVPICGSAEEPQIDGDGEPIEFAVEMRRFSQDELLVYVEERGELTFKHVERLAKQVAQFHAEIPVAPQESDFGSPESVRKPVLDNFSHLSHEKIPAALRSRLARLQSWAEDEFANRREWFALRKRDGRIRECHGDMHLGNMILHNGEIVIFDCIEFNDHLRWVDVASEVAFCTMDLEDRGQPELAARFLNAYLESTGDYASLWVLPYYLCYRAMVRAKVTWLRMQQTDGEEAGRLQQELGGYLALAERYAFERRGGLILMHGVSGTGKSFGALKIVDALRALRIRSDAERKRLAASSPADFDDLYSDAVTLETYERLEQIAMAGVQNGFVMVIDATFLEPALRTRFLDLAERAGCPVRIVSLTASESTLRRRITARNAAGGDPSDADLAVLDRQLRTSLPLSDTERDLSVDVDTEEAAGWQRAMERLRACFGSNSGNSRAKSR